MPLNKLKVVFSAVEYDDIQSKSKAKLEIVYLEI